jgi:hypothetical protein
MNKSLEQGSNISKMLDSCQLSISKFLEDTLLVILSPFASLRVNSAKNLKGYWKRKVRIEGCRENHQDIGWD